MTKRRKRLNRKNIIGKKFGRLRVVEYIGPDSRGRSVMRCTCDCGNQKNAHIGALRSGDAKSCGCITRENNATRAAKHNSSYTKLYKVWRHIKDRCFNENTENYKHYGGRGITMCSEWKDSFIAFQEWALTAGYKEGMSIDRINVDGDYSPDNCRWTTSLEQARNKRNSWRITINGENKHATEWCAIYNVSYGAAYSRKRKGWDDISCVTIPTQKRTEYKEAR